MLRAACPTILPKEKNGSSQNPLQSLIKRLFAVNQIDRGIERAGEQYVHRGEDEQASGRDVQRADARGEQVQKCALIGRRQGFAADKDGAIRDVLGLPGDEREESQAGRAFN